MLMDPKSGVSGPGLAVGVRSHTHKTRTDADVGAGPSFYRSMAKHYDRSALGYDRSARSMIARRVNGLDWRALL